MRRTLSRSDSVSFSLIVLTLNISPRHEKISPRRFANNKGADQPAYPRRLISAFKFLIRFLESIVCKLATVKGALAIRRIFSPVDMITKP